MSKRGLILVEGQTEERFVKQVLSPHFVGKGLFVTPTILTTKVVKNGPNFKGGVTSFEKFGSDLRRLLGGAGRDAVVTTLVDYYGLPVDFPGMASRPASATAAQRVAHVEAALAAHFNDGRLLPFLSLHEFEAWLFSCTVTLPRVMAQPNNGPPFAAICTSVQTPEEINERPDHNPAARLKQVFPGYRKVLHGPIAIERIGLATVREKCPHFNWWVSRLEAFAAA